jgi:hypothetical protein
MRHGLTPRRSRVSRSAHLGVQTWALGVNGKNEGQGREACMIKQSQAKCGLVDHHFSSGSMRGLSGHHSGE